ncbi:hypothetical protein [Vibrio phage JSF13]|nr:hypothetical protein TUST1-191_00405 [Vibrio phage ICP1_2006_D]ADX88354.1 hypothetical protein TUST1-182_00405 [Vibrio phage ICP1_2006_C]ADX88581.1 hypothetical protein TUST1-159_00405 [Vibrio phage ICP1_2006_B]ADX88807.1 hypothetical protein TUST1-17_00405 [Vibrio phage ICP1_2006_A]ADX89033.1 hypothetical protein TUST1-15_00405 [Vibrio phage ICP1_2005_A]ADX89265.1 hypothetical protein TUST1-2_00415 [Vibrio phage ICP1_2001_A]ADX89492.1 hypothetical protein TUST1-10_00400 [Vibrio phage ICP1
MVCSEYCKESIDTILHEWDYDQFYELEFFVDYRTDRVIHIERDQSKLNPQPK